MLIDSHAHIYVEAFNDDREEVLTRAYNAGVAHIVMPNINLATFSAMEEAGRTHKGKCHPTTGLHPCDVKQGFRDELIQLEKELDRDDIVGVGETGLDYYWDLSYKEEQKESFKIQLDWARETGKPVIIHSRDSLDDCIQLVTDMQDGRLTGVFHCFSGSREHIDRIKDLGFLIGIGGVATFKNGGLDKVLEKQDLSLMMLETDSPYLAPVPFRGKRNEPSYLPLVAKRLQELLQVGEEEVAVATTANALRLFHLGKPTE